MPRVAYSVAVKGSHRTTPAPAPGERAGDLRQRRLDAQDAGDAVFGENAVDAEARQGRGPSEMKFSPSRSGAAASSCGQAVCRQHGDQGRGRHAFAFHRRMLHRSLGKAQVALALGHRCQHGMRHQPRQYDVELRPILQEPADEARQEAVGQRRQGRDAQEAGAPVPTRLPSGRCARGRRTRSTRRRATAPRWSAPGRCRGARTAPGRAALQVADHAADRGLGDVISEAAAPPRRSGRRAERLDCRGSGHASLFITSCHETGGKIQIDAAMTNETMPVAAGGCRRKEGTWGI